jgi:hypothetical protein
VLQTNAIWIPSESPIIIDKPIDVQPWASLTIQAGVSIIFTSQDAGLRIYGKLIHLVKHAKHSIVRRHTYQRVILITEKKSLKIKIVNRRTETKVVKRKKTNNYLQNTSQKTKDGAARTPLRPERIQVLAVKQKLVTTGQKYILL